MCDLTKKLGVNGKSDKLLLLCRVSEQSDRFEDMIGFITDLIINRIKNEEIISLEERSLLSVAYKNIISNDRSSWRAFGEGYEQISSSTTDKYKSIVEGLVVKKCNGIINLLEKHIIPYTKGLLNKKDYKEPHDDDDMDENVDHRHENMVYYYKMCGDYYRYMCELDTENDELKKKASQQYNNALEAAKDNLAPTHPIYLGLALNFSVFYYEILKDQDKARKLAKEAFDNGVANIDKVDEFNLRDTQMIMQLLRDNLALWDDNEED